WRDTLQPAPIYTGAPPYMAPRLRCGRPAQSQAARQRLIRVKTTPYDLISSRRQRCGAALYLATCGRGPYDGIRHGFKRLSPMTVNTALATAPPSHLEQRCIESGMKMTGQRRIIARVLSDSLDHQMWRRFTAAPAPRTAGFPSPRSIGPCACSRKP